MDEKSNRYLEAAKWLIEAEPNKWYKLTLEQEAILKEMMLFDPDMPELTFKAGEVKITRWEKNRPV